MRENLVLFLVIKDLDMKGMTSTSGPFFSIPRARKDWKQQKLRWAKGPHSDATSVSSSTGGGIRRTCQDGLQKEGNKKITAIQRQESLTKCCPRASMCAPREKEGPGNQGQLWCPARNSETEPVGQGTEECAARSESNTDPALRTPRRH